MGRGAAELALVGSRFCVGRDAISTVGAATLGGVAERAGYDGAFLVAAGVAALGLVVVARVRPAAAQLRA